MYKQILAGVRILLVMTVLLGVLYPLGVWLVSRVPGLQANAEGSIVTQNGRVVGSGLIGIDPVAKDPAHDPWFHTRPSAASGSASGASNKDTSNPDLRAVIQQRKDVVAQREGVDQVKVPQDAVTASASGLDPQISPAYADLQAPRVARETGVPVQRIQDLIKDSTTQGIADPGVNVLKLNLAVQAAKGA